MEHTENNLENPTFNPFNRLVYIGMFLVGIVFVFLKDWSMATIFISLGLVFDPFDQTVTFKARPFWQKAWLIVHLIISFSLFFILILT